MKPAARLFVSAILYALLSPLVYSQEPPAETDLVKKLKSAFTVLDIQPIRTPPGAAEAYELLIEQPVDHADPAAGKFKQRVFISHVDFAKPVLLGTEGYAARGVGGGELQRLLAGNQVAVEHRFFGKSVPSPVRWEYLTVKQSAEDLHAVVSALRKLYAGKWISTGASKGGQTALFFKCYYPDDVDATVAYVAPINVTQEDPRIYQFIQTTGDDETRKKIKDFQIALFKREDEILPLVQPVIERNRWTFAMGLSKAYEYGVLEYPYAFWQYGTKASDIPPADASAAELAAHYNKVGTLRYYSDQGKKQFEPFLYQAFTEIGYYNYDITDFKPYIKTLTSPTNLDICPDEVRDKIVFNPATMYFVYHFLQYTANNVVYIYGDLDAWSATQMQLIGRTNAIKIVVKDAHHGARIAGFSPEQKELFFNNLDEWLGMKLPR